MNQSEFAVAVENAVRRINIAKVRTEQKFPQLSGLTGHERRLLYWRLLRSKGVRQPYQKHPELLPFRGNRRLYCHNYMLLKKGRPLEP